MIIDKQQIFWKRLSQIFIVLFFLLKFSWVFKIISCFSVDLRFITRFAFHDLTGIIQLQNILIHFIRTIISRNILYALIVMKVKAHIIEDVITISCNFTFSLLSVETKCIFFLETQEKIMQRMLCSARSTKTLKSIETINSHDDEYKFLNVQRWRITFSSLISSEYFSIFDFNEFVNVLSFTSTICLSFHLTLFCIYQISWAYQT